MYLPECPGFKLIYMQRLLSSIFFILFLSVLFPTVGLSQADHLCDQHHRWEEAIQEDSSVYYRHQELEAFTREYIQTRQVNEGLRIIPVVFHVMHAYGEENISKEQILNAVEILNQDFRRKNPDTSIIINAFKPLATDSEIEFRLAKLDPQGNCTEGIVRVYTDLAYAGSDDLKDFSRWPRGSYLNIWVVGSIASGAAGYSYYPGIGPDRDGIVIRHDYVGGIGTSSLNRSHTLTHEVGHYLNLAHPWGNSNEPGLADNCNIDDGVEDTPLTIGHTSCNLSAVTCGSLDNVQNFMEYSYCTRMFTHGQGARMQAALASSISERNSLWQESNLFETGTHPFYQAQPCIAQADFYAPRRIICPGEEVQVFELSFNGEVGTFEWYFPGGTPEFSNEQNPFVMYENPGEYPVQLKVINQMGVDSLIKQDFIQVITQDPSIQPPLTENFTPGQFPRFSDWSGSNWILEQSGNVGWEYTSTVGSDAVGALVVRNSYNEEGAKSTLLSPQIFLPENTESVQLSFDYAYAQAFEESDDEFILFISKDCGKTWQVRFLRSGYFLSSTGGEVSWFNFVPSNEEWIHVERDLTANVDAGGSFQLKFQMISSQGNNFFLDHINLGITLSADEVLDTDFQVRVYPNPTHGDGTVEMISPSAGAATVHLMSLQAGLIRSMHTALLPGNNQLALQAFGEMAAGVYFIKVETDWGTITRKLIVQ